MREKREWEVENRLNIRLRMLFMGGYYTEKMIDRQRLSLKR